MRWWLSCIYLFCSVAMAAEVPSRVLVLASYHDGLAWTDGQLEGLRRGLQTGAKPGGVAPELLVEFLDTKRVAPTPRYLGQVRAMLTQKYGEHRFSAIVAQDDDALDFVLAERRLGGLFEPQIPVIFSGISRQREALLAEQPAITGVFDDADIAANVSLLRTLRPALERVVFVHDHSRTGLAQADAVRALAKQFPGLRFEFLSKLPVAEIQSRLAALGASDGVMLLTFNIDGTGRILTHEEASRLWAEAASAPILVKEDVMMVPGVLGGLLVSSRRQGESAASALLQVLSGTDARSLPMRGDLVDPVFAYDQLQRFSIDLARLPGGSDVRGRPLHFYEEHPREFWLMAGLIGALLVLTILSGAMMLRARREQAVSAESARSQRELMNASHDAILIHAADGRILRVNDRFCSMFGYPRDDLPRLSVGRISEGEGPYTEAAAEVYWRRAMNEEPQLFEWRARRADGEVFWVEVGLRRAEIDGAPRLVATVRDIEQRKNVEAAQRARDERFEVILRKSPIGIVYFGTDLVITFCNDRFGEIIGTETQRLFGLDIQKLRDKCLQPACEDALAGRHGEYVGPYTSTTGGRSMSVTMRTAPIHDENGMIVGGIAIFEDITERVAAEQALRQLNEELEERVAERTAALQMANEGLREAMTRIAQSEKLASLGSLVAGVAHELNTPLGNARTVASTLHDRVREFQAEVTAGGLRKSSLLAFLASGREASLLIERNLERAATLLGNFKQVAVDQTSMRRRRFDLRQVIDEVLSTLQPKLKHHSQHIGVEVAEGIVLDSYPGSLEQVLTNFVLNSLIHGLEGREDGRIEILARCDADSVLIDYRDNGRGMDEASAARAFDPFYTTRLGQGGSGLGLYIVHNLVTGALGGSVTLVTAPDQGVRFTLRLPLVAPAVTSDAAAMAVRD